MAIDPKPTASGPVNWAELRTRIQGDIVPRAGKGYAERRRSCLWNDRQPDRFPDAIVQAASATDVQKVVRFARRHGVKVSVRSGGHHFSGPSMVQGGLLLDLGALKKISVDVQHRRAAVQAGVTAGELMAALAPHGLAFPVGHCRNVSMGGYLLAGGFGWNGGHWGPACANVTGIDMVDAHGASRSAGPDSNAELYWAARGGAMGFPGIVTGFHLALHPLPRAIKTATLTFSVDDMSAAAQWVAGIHPSLPKQVELIGLVVSPPPEARNQGAPPRVFVLSATAFADSEADAAAWLKPFDHEPAHPTPLDRTAATGTPFETLFDAMDQAFPEHHRYAADHLWSNSPPRQLLESARSAVLAPPSTRDFLLLAFAPSRQSDASPPPDMALSVLAGIYVGIYAVWNDPATDGSNLNWVRSMRTAMDHLREGRYIGEADIDAGPDSPKQCYAAGVWNRLDRIRRRFDPDDVFVSFPQPRS